MNFSKLFERIFFPCPVAKGPGLPDPPTARRKPKSAPKTDIKYTEKYGLPYVEGEPQGEEVSVWNMITPDTIKAAGRSPLGTMEEIEAATEKGFAAETVALIRMHWAEGKPQAAIAKATGFSLDTVKKITPIFSKGAKVENPVQ